ncbi:MAG TPA: S24 family peptidase [Caulobacteraceae bacterium]|nr:S24 family peptidase [Caulobacteraceae bacterium]
MTPKADNVPLSGHYDAPEGQSITPESEDAALGRNFAERLADALGATPQAVVAKRSRVSTSVFGKYLQGSEPGLFKAVRIARALGVDLAWLATGDGAPNHDAAGFVAVPIYDVRLAAGMAQFSDAARVVGQAPFDLQLLRQLGRVSAEGLGVLEAEGDSMEPTIPDGARVLIDMKDTRLREGIFGFRFDNDLRVKRLRRIGEGVEVISDNPRYKPELIEAQDLERFEIIGRVHWIGVTI